MNVLENPREAEWQDFLARMPETNIFQSPDMMKVYAQTRGYRPAVFAVQNHGQIEALMASTVIDYLGRASSILTSREVVTGGPLGDQDWFPELLAAHDRWARSRSALTEIRNLSTEAGRAVLDQEGYEWEDHLDYVVDLSAGEEDVLIGMAKGRRKGIAVAEHRGVDVVELRLGRLREAYRLLHQTYSRAGLPLAHVSLFENAFAVLKPNGELLASMATVDGTPCAVRFVLRWNGSLYDWYAGSSDLGRSVHADELIVWRTMQRGIELGSEDFDFGGAGDPRKAYGPREFKRRFGGKETNPGRFRKVHHSLLHQVTALGYEAWRKIR